MASDVRGEYGGRGRRISSWSEQSVGRSCVFQTELVDDVARRVLVMSHPKIATSSAQPARAPVASKRDFTLRTVRKAPEAGMGRGKSRKLDHFSRVERSGRTDSVTSGTRWLPHDWRPIRELFWVLRIGNGKKN
jgi:hypothetical protein